ncbi:MAG: hypothetical protein E7525_07065 [Ruminococcaceae bacterium]|nr:hypothetical protein [Oscillospiraceae bacterium]
MSKKNIIFALTFILIVTLCGCALSAPCSYEGCGDKAENGKKYCFTHSCLFCDNVIKTGTHYCTEHICKYQDSWGECNNAIIGKQDGDLYCDSHKNLDLDEFRKAKQLAADYNWTVARKNGWSLPHFSFTNEFSFDGNNYKFEIYDTETFRYGYIIIIKDSNDILTCDGMIYKR